ncbi:MAG: starch-binding protein, partial [Clostridiales bacterium]|nr:starch-binding protein [Clostridiales bacterium]
AVEDGSVDDLMAEYSSFISVTDSSYSDTVVQSVLDGSVTSSTGNWNTKGVSDDKILYWAESHDTYSNDGSYGTNSSEWSQNDVDRAYAILAAKADATTLYFSRPSETSKNSIMAGVKGSTHFTSAEVAEVNKFHNAMIGKAESYVAENGNAAVCREDGGAVIVTGSEGGGYVSITNGDSYVPEGDYIDQVSGNTFTVTSSTISGTVGSTGIAVIYNASTTPRASVSPESTTYNTDTLTLTLSCTNASSAQYSLDGGTTWTSYTNGQTITIGSDVDYGEATTVTVKASDGTTTSKEKSYTYTKVDPSAVQTIYFDNSSYGWSGVYAYIYLNGQYAPWPGTKMSLVSGSSTLYHFEVPEGYENALVIFTESSTATDNRYPADQEPGVPLNGCSMIMKADYEWVEYTGSESTTTATQATTASTAATEATQATTASTAATEATLPTASGRVLIGDANGDGVITISDATEIQKHVAGITYLSGNNAVAGDVDQSGYIDVKDATFVQKYLVDLFGDAAYCGQYIGEEEASAASATSVQTETQADSGNYIYFKKSDDWSQPYAYYWSGDNTYMTSWPGEAMTEVSDGIYRIEIPSDAEYIIFNPGSDNGKTEDLTIPGMNYIYENGSWSVYNG